MNKQIHFLDHIHVTSSMLRVIIFTFLQLLEYEKKKLTSIQEIIHDSIIISRPLYQKTAQLM